MTIIITGASKGLGLAIAEIFAADGKPHTFFLCARNKKNLEEAATHLQNQYQQIKLYTFTCDISVKEDVLAFATYILQQTNKIDILINNAGLFIPGRISEEADGALDAMMQTNLYSAYYLTKALLPAMKTEKKGHIFNICSIASLQALPDSFSYSISKVALMGFSKNLREELKQDNIKVTTVYPGAFMNESRLTETVDLNNLMQTNDIANMIYAAAHLSLQACVEEILLRPQSE